MLRQLHDELDAAVADAYGWPADLPDEEILARLVALNAERAAEEAAGPVRWLRPEYQVAGGRLQGARSPEAERSGGGKLQVVREPTAEYVTRFRGRSGWPSKPRPSAPRWLRWTSRPRPSRWPRPSSMRRRNASLRCWRCWRGWGRWSRWRERAINAGHPGFFRDDWQGETTR